MKKNKIMYACALLYVASVYLSIAVWWILAQMIEGDESSWIFLVFFVPVLVGIINGIVIRKNREGVDRIALLRCALLIKCLLIPIYIVGAVLIAILFLLIFTPIVIMMFFSPVMIALLCVTGWIYMAAGDVFSIAYLCRTFRQGAQSRILCIVMAVFQFIFVLDVIAVIIMLVKERKANKSSKQIN